MSRDQYFPFGISTLIASSIWLIASPVMAAEPLVALPPRTIPYEQNGAAGLPDHPGGAFSTLSGSATATRLIGITRPSQHAELRSAVGETIIEVAVKSGDRVKAGDLLVRLDDRIQQTVVKVAQVEAGRSGALSSAMIQLRLAELQLQRATLAFQRRAGSQFEVDEKAAARDEARARVTIEQESQARARASLERALAELEQYSIRAPFDGEVVQVHQHVGTTTDRSKPVITIADRRKLNVELHLPLTEFGTVSRGSVFSVRADAPVNRTLKARVTAVSPYVNAASRTCRVELEIDNSNQQLPAGFTIRHDGSAAEKGLAEGNFGSSNSQQR